MIVGCADSKETEDDHDPISNWDGFTLPIPGQEKKGDDHPTDEIPLVYSRCDPRSGQCTHLSTYDINSDHDDYEAPACIPYTKDLREYVEGTPVVTQATKMWNGVETPCTVLTTGVRRTLVKHTSLPILSFVLHPRLHYEIKSDSLLIVDRIIFSSIPVSAGVSLKDGEVTGTHIIAAV